MTDKKFRGQGLMKALIQQAIARAKQQQRGERWRFTPDQQAYYQRSGWQAVKQRQTADDEVTMLLLHLAQ